jgi:hypothetical protein
MYVDKIIIPRIRKDGSISQRPSVLYRFKCDECNIIYDKKPGTVSRSKSGLHFCSNKCKFLSRMKGKKLKLVCEHTCLQKYGTSNPFQSEIVKEHSRQSFQAKYGPDVCYALQVPGALAKRRRTHLERYGYEETFQSPILKDKRRLTWMKKYGVPYKPFYQTHDELIVAMQKSFANHPNAFSSKAEIMFCESLAQKFGHIIRQKHVHKWPIDVYIPSIDTYVQFDGVYWHGLDRPIEIIKESQGKRDQAIYHKWLIDQEQNEWFASHNLRLMRITDVEFKNDPLRVLNALK